MRAMLAVVKRELGSYFATPVAYVFIVIFLVLAGVFTFAQELGQLYERGQADMRPFFGYLPWLYLFLAPAVTMRLWAEERRGGTIEMLSTLPIPPWAAVVGKFLAAWAFLLAGLVLTIPVWITVTYLGKPDHGTIAAGYLGAALMAGAFLAIGACISALTKSQVIAFVLTVVVCFGFMLAGYPFVQGLVQGWAHPGVGEMIARFSFLTRFDSISKGVLDPRDLVFFLSIIGVMLAANAIVVDLRKAA